MWLVQNRGDFSWPARRRICGSGWVVGGGAGGGVWAARGGGWVCPGTVRSPPPCPEPHTTPASTHHQVSSQGSHVIGSQNEAAPSRPRKSGQLQENISFSKWLIFWLIWAIRENLCMIKNYLKFLLTGNIFTRVCHSIHRGVCPGGCVQVVGVSWVLHTLPPSQIRRDTVNRWSVCILPECILVLVVNLTIYSQFSA